MGWFVGGEKVKHRKNEVTKHLAYMHQRDLPNTHIGVMVLCIYIYI